MPTGVSVSSKRPRLTEDDLAKRYALIEAIAVLKKKEEEV